MAVTKSSMTISTLSTVLLLGVVFCTDQIDKRLMNFEDIFNLATEDENLDMHLSLQRDILEDSISRQSWHVDPDASKNLTELILSQGYICEQYTVQTSDGFLLDLHRIPYGRHCTAECRNHQALNKPVVYLQHGLLTSACDWVINFSEGSLGFLLADAGYDVWMGNSRGNTYSRRHIHLTPDDEQFWDWSFDEMARYDLPAFIDFALNQTKAASLFYIGHSQGTTVAFALLSQRPDMRQKIRLFFALSPVAQLTHTRSAMKYLASVPDNVIYLTWGRKQFLGHGKVFGLFADFVCTNRYTRRTCMNAVFLYTGFDVANINQSRIHVYLNHFATGVSVRNMVHFRQIYSHKKFAMYDYGSPTKNNERYKQSSPPEYNLTNINVPVIIFTGSNDLLPDPQDIAALAVSLPNLLASYVIKGWSHPDFVWGLQAASLCYRTILELMGNVTV